LRKISDSFVTEIHDAIENLPGSLPARRLLLRQALEQLDALAAESNDNPVLQDELARAYFNTAHLPDMLLAEKDSTFKKVTAIYRQIIAQDPANINYQEQLALGEIALGDVAKVRGSVAGALGLHRTGVARLEQVVESEPNRVAHRVNLSYAYLDTAVIYILKGDVEAAAQITRKVSATTEELLKTDAADPDLNQISDQAQILTAVEETLDSDYKPAIVKLRRILAEYQIKSDKTPNDTRIKYFLWTINRRLAEALEKDGNIYEASRHLQTALSIIESLLAASPKDFGYHRNSAVTNIFFGHLLILQKQPARAIPHFRRALQLSEQVLEIDPVHSESKTDEARANANLGRALVLIGKKSEGLEYLNKAQIIFEQACRSDNENAQLTKDYSQVVDWLNSVSGKSR